MSEYHFGVGTGRVSQGVSLALNRIAKKHGAFFTSVDMPEGPRYWFGCQNLGSPFDQEVSAAVLREAQQSGLWRDGRPINLR